MVCLVGSSGLYYLLCKHCVYEFAESAETKTDGSEVDTRHKDP